MTSLRTVPLGALLLVLAPLASAQMPASAFPRSQDAPRPPTQVPSVTPPGYWNGQIPIQNFDPAAAAEAARKAKILERTKSGQADQPGNNAALNPQPLPPKPQMRVVKPAPVPLPPKELATQSPIVGGPGSKVSLNPQPLPPKEQATKSPLTTPPGGKVSLNPQPLPPKENVKPMPVSGSAAGAAAGAGASVAAGATTTSTSAAIRLPTAVFDMPDNKIILLDGKSIPAAEVKKAIKAQIAASVAQPKTTTVKTRKLDPATLGLIKNVTAAIAANSNPVQKAALSQRDFANDTIARPGMAQRVAATKGVPGIGALTCQDKGAPKIEAIGGKLRPGATVTIDGLCFGNRTGRVEIIGQFPGNKLTLPFTAWDMTRIQIQVPGNIRGAADHAVSVSVVTAEGKVSPASVTQFIAARERIDVPERLWSPTSSFDIADAIDQEKPMNKAYQGSLQRSLRVNPQCTLDSMEIDNLAGYVSDVRGFEQGPPNEAAVTIDWNGACTGNTITRTVKILDTVVQTTYTSACHAAFRTKAWAYCPAGMAP